MAICTWAARPPTTKSTFWFSISSLVRWAPTAGLSSSSRNRTSILRPIAPPLALSSSMASWAPFCMSAAMAANVPVSGSGKPIRIGSLLWARSTAGKATSVAPAVAVVRNSRRCIATSVGPPCVASVLGWRAPGVVGVLTGDGAARLCKPYRGVLLHYKGMKTGAMLPLAVERVRYVGEPIVVIAAESRAAADDAAALVEVEYEPLPAVLTPGAALAVGAPLIHPE